MVLVLSSTTTRSGGNRGSGGESFYARGKIIPRLDITFFVESYAPNFLSTMCNINIIRDTVLFLNN